MKYIFVVLLIYSGFSFGEPSDCSQIEDSEKRLACFDSRFPGSAAAKPVPETTSSETGSEIRPSGKTPVNQGTLPTATTTSERQESKPSEIPASKPPEAGPASGKGLFRLPRLFGARDNYVVNAKIKAILNGDQQKMVFLLDNGQIWLQSSPRNLPFHKGDDVTIKSGTMGGYILRTISGTSTRVRRIKP